MFILDDYLAGYDRFFTKLEKDFNLDRKFVEQCHFNILNVFYNHSEYVMPLINYINRVLTKDSMIIGINIDISNDDIEFIQLNDNLVLLPYSIFSEKAEIYHKYKITKDTPSSMIADLLVKYNPFLDGLNFNTLERLDTDIGIFGLDRIYAEERFSDKKIKEDKEGFFNFFNEIICEYDIEEEPHFVTKNKSELDYIINSIEDARQAIYKQLSIHPLKTKYKKKILGPSPSFSEVDELLLYISLIEKYEDINIKLNYEYNYSSSYIGLEESKNNLYQAIKKIYQKVDILIFNAVELNCINNLENFRDLLNNQKIRNKFYLLFKYIYDNNPSYYIKEAKVFSPIECYQGCNSLDALENIEFINIFNDFIVNIQEEIFKGKNINDLLSKNSNRIKELLPSHCEVFDINNICLLSYSDVLKELKKNNIVHDGEYGKFYKIDKFSLIHYLRNENLRFMNTAFLRLVMNENQKSEYLSIYCYKNTILFEIKNESIKIKDIVESLKKEIIGQFGNYLEQFLNPYSDIKMQGKLNQYIREFLLNNKLINSNSTRLKKIKI